MLRRGRIAIRHNPPADRCRPTAEPESHSSNAGSNCRGAAWQGSAAPCRTDRGRCARPFRPAASHRPAGKIRADGRRHRASAPTMESNSSAKTDRVACPHAPAARGSLRDNLHPAKRRRRTARQRDLASHSSRGRTSTFVPARYRKNLNGEENGTVGWLDGQVALVTGGGSGIGRAVVARFIAEGARVGVLDRVPGRADELRAEFGDAVVAVTGDVAQLADNTRAVTETVAALGRLDVFVGNAGVFDNFLSLAEFPEETLSEACDELFGVNVKGCILGAKAALLELAKTDGSMVFTASVAGSNSGGGGPLYTASKHAVVGLIRQLAVELGPRIRVNGVAPGGTITDLRGLLVLRQDGRSQFADPSIEERMRANNPLQIALAPGDLAGAYVFLSSRTNARGITGTILTVDAGATLRMPRRT